MAIGKFFGEVFGGKDKPQPQDQPKAKSEESARQYANYQARNAKGGMTQSFARVTFTTLRQDLLVHLSETLRPAVEERKWSYVDDPTTEQSTEASIVILDVTPKTDARLHDRYDKVVRLKKSMNKNADILCLIGRREDHKKYPRGTYPNCYFFCLKDDNLEHCDSDLPPAGAETVVGPRLFNFCEIIPVITRRIEELSAE